MVNKAIENLFLTKAALSEKAFNIAKIICRKYKFKAVKGDNDKTEIYVYENGIYAEKGLQIIEESTQKICEHLASKNVVNEVVATIVRQNYINRSELDFVNPDEICIENGILNMRTKERREHTSDEVFLTKIPIKYDKDAKCDVWLNFLNSSLCERDLDVAQEWFGYCLYKKNIEKKALILLGPKDSGKTVFLNTFFKLFGDKNCSGTDLHDLMNDKFATESLYKKYCNVSDELNSDDLRNVVKFKRLTGRTTMQGEPKFKSRFNFEPYVKLICGANKMPMLTKIEEPESYYDRWLVFVFDNVVSMKDGTMDKTLIDKIGTKGELSGMLNWALDGLDRLLKNGEFSNLRDWRDNERIMGSNGKSLYSFFENCVVKEEGAFQDNGEFYDLYCEYCKLNDKSDISSKDAFGKTVIHKILEKFSEKRYNGNGKNGYANITVNKENFLRID